MVCWWFGLKTTGTVYDWFGLKTSGTVFSGLASKPVAMVFFGLASKPMTWVSRFGHYDSFLVWASKPGRLRFVRCTTKQMGG
jgi:hypothetical protein